MHARSSCTWSIVSIFLLLLLVLVLNTAKHIILLVSMPYLYCYRIFIFSLLLFFFFLYSCGPLLTELYYFSVSRSERRYRELIIEHILIQLFSDEFSFFSWLVLFRYGGWYCLWFSISYMCFIPALGCICIYVCYPTRCWQLKVITKEIFLFMSICWPSSHHHTLYFGKWGVTS